MDDRERRDGLVEDGEYGYVDIEVPDDVSRLDLVMTWEEPPADAIASTVLNDLTSLARPRRRL